MFPLVNPPTAYGFGLLRPEHRQPVPEIGLPLLQEVPGSLEASRLSVSEIEGEHGPFTENLVPKLIEVSSALLANANVDDSIKALSRALHLTRVNNGLNTALQIPILEQLIGIHITTSQWQLADQYLANQYRLRQMQYSGYDPEVVNHLKRYADWHRTMYLAGVDEIGYVRLLSMHELYTGMSKIIETELGKNSNEHLPYLYGQLEAEHLISLYEGERETGLRVGMRNHEEVKLPTWEKQRFRKIKDNNYRNGKKTIKRILAILEKDPEAARSDIADAKLALGDWYTWFHQPAPAKRSYHEAYTIMAQEENGNAWLADKFGEPRELPASAVFQPGVIAPKTSYKDIDVRLRFDVSRLGKARRIQILSPSRKENANATIRAYKMLRDTRFRPAMRKGELVAAKDLERNYKIAY
ncbi:MAG: energy transducer TonB [Pseudomonadales bacterium]